MSLSPLDPLETKTYLANHSRFPHVIDDSSVVDRIHLATGGYPFALDELAEKLEVCSVDELLDSTEMSMRPAIAGDEPVPKSLRREIDQLRASKDEADRRSYRLLQVLSVMSHGEQLTTVHKIFPKAPFWLDHAIRLVSSALIEAIPLATPLDQTVAKSLAQVPKLLRCSRSIREYGLSLTDDEQRDEIYTSAAECLFGRHWRQGKVKLVDREMFSRRELGPGNEQVVCLYLIRRAVEQKDWLEAGRCIQLALQYVQRLQSAARFREVLSEVVFF